MGWTKGQLVSLAFDEIGLASYTFDTSPDEFQAALNRMDAMMAAWSRKGIRPGYNTPGSASSDPKDDSGLPDWANEAVYQNLAIRLGPSNGRQISTELNKTAKLGYDMLLSAASHPPEMRMPPSLPSGAGVKPWRGPQRPFIDDPDLAIETGPDAEMNIGRNET